MKAFDEGHLDERVALKKIKHKSVNTGGRERYLVGKNLGEKVNQTHKINNGGLPNHRKCELPSPLSISNLLRQKVLQYYLVEAKCGRAVERQAEDCLFGLRGEDSGENGRDDGDLVGADLLRPDEPAITRLSAEL